MNITYHYDNLRKHGITPDEVNECLNDPNRIRLRKGNTVLVIGKTFSGRLIEIGANEKGFVYHAMDVSNFGYSHYMRKKRR